MGKALKPGTVLRSPTRDYVVVKVLGQGGFGITYLVESDVKVGSIVMQIPLAVKEHFIASICGRDADSQLMDFSDPVADTVLKSKQAFTKEARRLKEIGIDHPNIVKIDEVFEANNTAYYVMEYLKGETLSDYVRSRGPLDASEAEALLRPVAEAVAELHRQKLTHYDIKPQNIIIAANKGGGLRPVLIDFGLAKHYDNEGDATSTLGLAGFSKGFAPIEQYSGLTQFTPQADVYALGATLFYCLTGQRPADATEFSIEDELKKINSGIPKKMKEGLVHAMQMSKKQRTPDAGAFISEVFGKSSNKLELKNDDDDATVFDSRPVKPAPTIRKRKEPERKPAVAPISTPPAKRRMSVGTWVFLSIGIVTVLLMGLIFLSYKIGDPDQQSSVSGIEGGNDLYPRVTEEMAEVMNNATGVSYFSEGLVAVCIEGKWGYMDVDGKMVVNPQFEYASPFSEGYAVVETAKGKYGYMNKNGLVESSKRYDFANDFSEGFASVKKDGKYAYINKKWEQITPFEFDTAGSFSEGLAGVSKGERYGFIDTSGQMVIKPRFLYVTQFSEGLAACEGTGGKWGYINPTGRGAEIRFIYEYAYPFSESLACVCLDGKYGYINKEGEVVIPFQYTSAGIFSEGLARVSLGGKSGYIDKSGEVVITGDYTEVYDFSDGMALVKQNDKYGYIDKTGKMVIPARYGMAGFFNDGFAWVLKDGKYGLVDKYGTSTFDFQ